MSDPDAVGAERNGVPDQFHLVFSVPFVTSAGQIWLGMRSWDVYLTPKISITDFQTIPATVDLPK